MSQVRTDRLDESWAESLDRIRAFVAARVDDPELAADITHDVVVRSIASGALERVDNPAAWLYRSARNAVIDHYRTRHVHEPLDDVDSLARPWPDRQPAQRRHPRARPVPAADAPPATPGGAGRTHPGRRRRPDAPAGGRPARHLRVRDEVPGAASPPSTQGPARAVLHGPARPSRRRHHLPRHLADVRVRGSNTLPGAVLSRVWPQSWAVRCQRGCRSVA